MSQTLARLSWRLARQDWERHPLAIAAAVPEGSVRAPSRSRQVAYRAALEASPVLGQLRSDAFANVVRVGRALANHVDWSTGTTRPTWARLMAETGLSRRTIARCIRLLHDAGLLGTVAGGRSPGTVPMALDDGQAFAAVYVLAIPRGLLAGGNDASEGQAVEDHPTGSGAVRRVLLSSRVRPRGRLITPRLIAAAAARGRRPAGARTRRPAVDQTGTPSRSPKGTLENLETPSRAREARDLGPAELIASGRLWKPNDQARTKAERVLAAAELRRRDVVLRRSSTPAVASALRVWLLAGWTVRDVLYAINHRPDGTSWPHNVVTADIRHVPGFIRYRLSAWLTTDETGTRPGPSRGQRIAAAERLEAALHRAELERDTETRATSVHRTQHAGVQAALDALRQRRRSTRGWVLDLENDAQREQP